MKNKLIILSADAMVTEDLELFSTLPGYQKYLDGGCRINRVESIYPTVTYPCHTTMMTGNYPIAMELPATLFWPLIRNQHPGIVMQT